MSCEVQRALERDGDCTARGRGRAGLEHKRTVAFFITAKADTAGAPAAAGDIALDVASEGLLDPPVPRAGSLCVGSGSLCVGYWDSVKKWNGTESEGSCDYHTAC